MSEHPDLQAELDRVAARMDAEVRAEQADYERMALQSHQRGRSLAGVAREWMNHGDTVTVSLCGVVLTGRVRHVAADLLVLESPTGDHDVRLSAGPVLRRAVVDPEGLGVPVGGAKSFVARMREHEMAEAIVEVALLDGSLVQGGVLAAADDHLLLSDRVGQVVLPVSQIGIVRPVS